MSLRTIDQSIEIKEINKSFDLDNIKKLDK